jgi:integrase
MQTITKSARDWGLIQKKDKDGNSVWYARITRVEGNGKKRQYTARAENKSHAKRLRDELIEKYKDNGEKAIGGARLNFRELAEDYRGRKLIPAKYHQNRKVAGLRSHRAALNHLSALLRYFGSRKIKDITPAEVEKFKQHRLDEPIITKKKDKKGVLKATARPRAIASVNRELALLRTILNDAVSNGWLNRSPFLGIKGLVSLADEVQRERVLLMEEEQRLLEACSEIIPLVYKRGDKQITAQHKSNRKHLRPLIIVALDTAMRSGELLKLRWRDVHFKDRTIHILAFNTKTAKERTVGMTQRVYEELVELWENSPRDMEGLVFGIKDTVKRSFTSACRDAGIANLRFHDFRHTAITRMVNAGLPPMEIMKVSGHTQWTTFARYVNPGKESVRRIADVLTAHNLQSHSVLESNSIN